MSWSLLATIFGGTFFGSFLGPLLLEEWRAQRDWGGRKATRKKLLKQKLTDAKGEGWISLDALSTLIGTSADECRGLLIEIGARGGKMKSEKEGWALISRRPLSDSDTEGG